MFRELEDGEFDGAEDDKDDDAAAGPSTTQNTSNRARGRQPVRRATHPHMEQWRDI